MLTDRGSPFAIIEPGLYLPLVIGVPKVNGVSLDLQLGVLFQDPLDLSPGVPFLHRPPFRLLVVCCHDTLLSGLSSLLMELMSGEGAVLSLLMRPFVRPSRPGCNWRYASELH